jgi:hypothetical protein
MFACGCDALLVTYDLTKGFVFLCLLVCLSVSFVVSVRLFALLFVGLAGCVDLFAC